MNARSLFSRLPLAKFLQRSLIVICCLFALSSCSTKIAYNFLDWIFNWQIGKYVTLNKEQKKFTAQVIDRFHNWHREDQLPRYTQYVADLKQRLIREPLSSQEIHDETDKVQLLVDDSIDYLMPSIVDLASTLSDQQVEELLKKLAKKRKKYAKKYLDISPKKVEKKRIKELTTYTSRFLGRLTKEQQSWVTRWSKELIPSEKLTLKQQEIWAKKVEQAMEVRKNKPELERHLRELIFYRTDNWDQELEEILDENQEKTYSMLAKLVANLTPKQKKKMHRKLDQYIQDFTALSQTK